jgi:hypothetical protein
MKEAAMALAPTLIIERRRNALVAEWKQNPLIVVQVESPAVLPALTFLDDRGQGGGVGAVGRRSQTNTVIVSRVGGDPDRNGSVWVKASYTGYRTAFIGFLNHVYGTQATTADLAGYDVDHLLNRARSPGRRLHPHRGRQFDGQPGLGTAVREGGEQPGLLCQPAAVAANLELGDLR